jgi:hypothetical protein
MADIFERYGVENGTLGRVLVVVVVFMVRQVLGVCFIRTSRKSLGVG